MSAGLRVVQLHLAQQEEARSRALAEDVRTLSQWLGRDVLSPAGADLATRQDLYDFIVVELQRRENADVRRIRPIRVALQHQRDALLARAKVLDDKLAAIAKARMTWTPTSCARRVCCTASPATRPRTGSAGTGCAAS